MIAFLLSSLSRINVASYFPVSSPPKDAVPTCSQAGVFGAVAGMLGTIQAAEAVRFITGVGDLLTNRILIFDALNMKFRTVKVKPSELDITGFQDNYDQPVCELKRN